MDIIRRNTDYALRAVVALAGENGSPVSTKALADSQSIPYQLACKLLQRLHNAGIVKSTMGPSGGFTLGKNPSKITVRQVVEAVQGPLSLSPCLFKGGCCSLSKHCPINPELGRLQKKINAFLDGLTLRQLSATTGQKHNRRIK
jgi:Rrf2 family protein